MSAADPEFLRLLKKDIDYFERAVERFEELVPRVSAPIQDQWRLRPQCGGTLPWSLKFFWTRRRSARVSPRPQGGTKAEKTTETRSTPIRRHTSSPGFSFSLPSRRPIFGPTDLLRSISWAQQI